MNETKSKRDRSPRYPNVGLGEAIGKIKALYEREGKNFVAREVAVKSWDYKSLHGGALTLMATLGQYGLIDQNKGQIKISQDGWTIIEAPKDTVSYTTAITKCAMTPVIFQELSNEYGDNLPSDDTLRWELRKKGFTGDASLTVIQSFRDTIAYLKECKAKNNDSIDNFDEKNTTSEPAAPSVTEKSQKATIANSDAPTYTFPLLKKTASLTIVGGEATDKDIDLLIQFLTLFKASLESKEKGLPKNE